MSECDGELAAPAVPLAATERAMAATRLASMMRDTPFSTSYRVGGFLPTEAMTQLPSFGQHEG